MQCSSNSCSSGCGGHTLPCPCPEEGNPEIDSLEKVVNCFWQKNQDLAVERDYYESLESLADAVDEAAQALGDENLGYNQPDAISRKVLTVTREKLVAAENELSRVADFTKLHAVVCTSIGDLAGLTPALVYLTALRIGLQARVHPQHIYLDAGAREGCAALVGPDLERVVLPRDQLPRIFQHPELTTEDVQSCLTVCRHQLDWLGRQQKRD
ncbi:MAG: hypothetical protein C0623_01750 [Desulfuromonas sp.]|nr:MAG: hypothetical protein C0623_01750 [Desulfuromonas sp.]